MPHVHDDSRWIETEEHVFVRAVGGEGPNATDGALELATSEGLDITEVTGTGKGGRITKADVEAYLAAAE